MATYALVPDGGGDPWEWHRLVPELEDRGHEAIALRLPAEDETASWSGYTETVVAASMGGFTAPIEFQRRIARQRLGVEVEEIDGGHMVALGHPAELANRLEAYRIEAQGGSPGATRA